jgi:hypothetical protein
MRCDDTSPRVGSDQVGRTVDPATTRTETSRSGRRGTAVMHSTTARGTPCPHRPGIPTPGQYGRGPPRVQTRTSHGRGVAGKPATVMTTGDRDAKEVDRCSTVSSPRGSCQMLFGYPAGSPTAPQGPHLRPGKARIWCTTPDTRPVQAPARLNPAAGLSQQSSIGPRADRHRSEHRHSRSRDERADR